MNNTSESDLAARRAANNSRQTKCRANKREAKKQKEEKALKSLCSLPQYLHLYEGPESDESEVERKNRHRRVKRNIIREGKILKEERDLENNECRSKFPCLRLYDARPFGESNGEKKARGRKIRRQMANGSHEKLSLKTDILKRFISKPNRYKNKGYYHLVGL